MVAPKEFDKSWVHPIQVIVEGSSREDFEYAARKFKTIFGRERVIRQLKERSTYEKPSAKKRRKAREAITRNLLAERREQMIVSGEWDRSQRQKAQKRINKAEKSAGVIDD